MHPLSRDGIPAPFASLQIYSGDIFEQTDQARDFVLAKISRAVGTRAAAITAPVTYELPPDAVGEAIVNAIAHRDYLSNASVEVRLFADRLEVWDPGVLPGTLSLESLRTDHASIPYNPLLAESLYLTSYIEKVGSGTQAIIDLCREANLPEPDFELRQGFFVITLWRDWLTEELLARLDLSDRQLDAVAYLKAHRRITNREYQSVVGVSRATAARDLEEMLERGVVERIGTTGRATHYVLNRKRLTNDS